MHIGAFHKGSHPWILGQLYATQNQEWVEVGSQAKATGQVQSDTRVPSPLHA